MKYTRQRYVAAEALEEVQDPKPRCPQRRMGYFDLHPERRCMQVSGDEDVLDQFAQAAGDIDALPRPSDTTAFIRLARRRQRRRSRYLPDSILNSFILTPPLAPSPSLPLCRPQHRALRRRHTLSVTCNDSRGCATDCQESPARR